MAETLSNKTSVERLLDKHLKDLILPENMQVDGLPIWMVFLITSVITLLALITIWRWYLYRNSPRQKARRKLAQLQGFASKTKNQQSIAIQLSSTLRQGLQIKRLELHQPKRKLQWQTFLKELETASYSPQPPSTVQLNTLFKQSHDWLKTDEH